MAPDFDPYHHWLGIPPEEQPANHYRLLGVTLFETNRDVIAAAANRQMSYLQELASGPDVAEAQKLLSEISQARVCLLNAKRKAAYDEQLRSTLPVLESGEAQAEEEGEEEEVEVEQPAAVQRPDVARPASSARAARPASSRSGTARRPTPRVGGKSKENKNLPLLITVAGGTAVAVAVLIVLLLGGSGKSKKTNTDEKPTGSNTSSATFRTKTAGEIALGGPAASNIDPPEQTTRPPAPPKSKPGPTPKPAPPKTKTVDPVPTQTGDNGPEADAAALLQSKGLEEGFNGTWQLVNEQTRKLEALETSGSSGTAGGAAFEAELKRRVDAKKKEIMDRWIWVRQQPAGNPQLDAEYHHLMTIVAYPGNPNIWYVRDEVSEITSIRAEVEQEFASRAPATVDPAMAGLIEDIRKRYATLAADEEVQAALETVDGTLAEPPGDVASTEPAPAGDPDAQVAGNEGASDEAPAKPPLTHFLQRKRTAEGGPRKLLTERGLVEQDGVWTVRETGARRNLQNVIRKFSPRQQELLEEAIDEYRKYTKIIYGGMLNDAQRRATSAGRPGSIAFRDEDWARFDFLARHHPDINAEEFGIVRMSSTLFFIEALRMSLKRYQNNPQWGAAGSLYRNPQREQQVKEAREAELEQDLQHRYRMIAEDRDVRRALKRLGHRLANNPGQTSRSLPPTVDRKRPAVFHQNPFHQNPAATFADLKEQLTAGEKQTKRDYAKFNNGVKEYTKEREEFLKVIQPLQGQITRLQAQLDAMRDGERKVAFGQQIEAGPMKKLNELQQKLSALPKPNPAQVEAALATAEKLIEKIRGMPEYAENESSIEKLAKKIEKTQKAFAGAKRKLAKKPK